MTVGAQLIVDITVTTNDSALAVAGSANNYDNTIATYNPGLSTIAPAVFCTIEIPSVGCLGGLPNLAIPVTEEVTPAGVETEFLAVLGLVAAGGNGTTDIGIDGIPGGPQFQLIFDTLTTGATTINIGTYALYLDGYLGSADDQAINTSVSINVIPEPNTALLLGLGFAALSSRSSRKTHRI